MSTGGVGLITGLNISTVVSDLMTVAEQPVTALQTQDTTLDDEQTAYKTLMADLLGVQNDAKSLQQASLYTTRSATSSNASALGATVTGTPALGTYSYTPVQVAQAEQLLSSGLPSETTSLGAGTFTFRFGGGLNQSVSLDSLNGGNGFVPGEIKITDRSGATATINLSTAQTIGDVINDINNNGTANVTAVADGDRIDLIDNTGDTGASASNLRVQEVDGGSTAASLGLAGINVAASTADGNQILSLSSNLDLNVLNDGAGVSTSTVLPDIGYTLANGDHGTIELAPIASGSTTGTPPTTLGEIVDEINAAAPGELSASIDSTNNRLVITDKTTPAPGGGTFTLTALNGSTALYDLGLTNTVSGGTATGTGGEATDTGGTITGRSILGGLQSVLLSSLNGGAGLGTLGNLDLTDRDGNSATVDLSSAQTVQQVIDAINQATDTATNTKLGITAQLNAAGNGIQLIDTTGGAGKMIVANDSDRTTMATKLGIAVDSDVSSVNSGDMHLRVISMNTELSSLNGGAGVADGTVKFTDSTGKTATLTVDSSMQTVGDVVNAINRLGVTAGLNITASLNSTGDGILLTDTGGGSGTMSVAEGDSTTAADLNLLQTASGATINGTMTHTIPLTSSDSLDDLVTAINNLNAGVTAAVVNDGSSNPYRLTLTSSQSGTAGALVVDTSGMGTSLPLTESVQPQNALLALGNSSTASNNVLVSSPSNSFTNVLSGATLQVNSATGSPVSITVSNDETELSSAIQSMVTDYNTFQSALTSYTAYDTSTNTGGVLANDPTAAQLGSEVSGLMNGMITGAGSITSLAQLGVTVNSDGSLTFDSSTFSSAYESDPDAVQQFFTNTTNGFAVQLDNLMTQVAGSTNSLLSGQVSSLASTVTDNNNQITSLNTMLGDEQTRLYNEFYNMESAISTLQTNMSIVDTFSLLNSDGTSTDIFPNDDASTLGSNLANIIESLASSAAAEANASSSSGSTSTSGTGSS
jgi:flagellar hook-associated protein 2